MNEQVLYSIIGLAILVAFAGWFLMYRRPKPRPSVQNDYISGLYFLLWGDQDRALEKLRDVVRRDTDYIDAYILIGNIFREKGAYESAVKVHRDLLLRPNLTLQQQKTILMNLAQDYYKNGQLKWAQSTCDKLIELDKKDEWPKEFKRTLYESMEDWEGAFETLRRFGRMDKKERMTRLALYKVEQGLQLAKLGREHDARLCWREAIKWDEKCYPARLELVKSYFRENRNEDALEELQQTLIAIPEYADHALDAFQDKLYEMGRFDEIERLYNRIIDTHPHLIEAYISLAEIYSKKGELERAAELCRQALTHAPNHRRILLMLALIELKLGQTDTGLKQLEDILKKEAQQKNEFICAKCRTRQSSYFWRCTSCGAWNSAERL
ncbi:MAG: tetratricopeptide repeat protein [candidate division KSB1 bacterium]|nr:tetratricopeptide repeat protein [candidate division KSB1 bacterium]